MTNTPYAPPATTPLEENEKICSTCNAVIHRKAEICPKCGVRQRRPASKSALLLINFFLGGFGGHRFYLGNYVLGSLYLLFFWTLIPSLIAFIEFIWFAFMSSEKIENDYTAHGSVAAFVVPTIFSFFIIAAIFIPAYQDYLQKTKVAEAMTLFTGLKTEAETYLSNTGKFPETKKLSIISGEYTKITSNPEEFYLQAMMNEKAGSIAGEIIRFSYDPASKTWKCSADFPNGVANKYLPKNCRTEKQQ
ncbi:TM2 protein [Thioploca ingrica]|uniref:TM2 protein n=1 Tax=Thioploca ingrica TaxID=40754 RepID=A0A090AG39_9GAMM|nr:TM2 protein [Thioploca ingrica]